MYYSQQIRALLYRLQIIYLPTVRVCLYRPLNLTQVISVGNNERRNLINVYMNYLTMRRFILSIESIRAVIFSVMYPYTLLLH